MQRKRNLRYGIVALGLLLLIALTGLIVWLSTRCWTRRCHIGTRVAKHMDFGIDPCEDFYNFSCGGWVKDAEMPSGKTFG